MSTKLLSLNKIHRTYKIMALVIVAAFFTIPSFAIAKDYYVRSNTGEYGTEDGSSYANAFDGFNDIDWSAVDSGNGKLFVCGNFAGEQLVIGTSGEAGTPITIVSCTKANGADVDAPGIIDGTGTNGLSNGEGLVDALSLSYIVLDGLEIRNSPQTLVRMKSCEYSIIQNCEVHDNENSSYSYAHGINLKFSQHCQVRYNEVYASNRNAIVVEGAEFNIIEGNYVHDNPAHNCLDFKEGSGGTVLKSGNIVRYNRFTGCTNGILSAFQSNQLIHDNLIYKNHKSGIWFITTGSPSQVYVANSKIYNNTFADNAWDGIQNDYAQNLTIKNNIFMNGRNEIAIASSADKGHTLNHNLYGTDSTWKASGVSYSSLSAWQSGTSNEKNSIEEDPLFTNRNSFDFSLKEGSPAIDAGTSLSSEGISDDINRTLRPQGNAYDIGAYEYITETALNILFAPINLRIVLN